MISSVHNPKVQAIRKLQAQAKVRREEHAFVIEGVRLVEEALAAGWQARLVLYTDKLDERGLAVVDLVKGKGIPVEHVNEAVMRSVSETEEPQGVLVVLSAREILIPSSPDFILVLDGLRDPGNLGTILRTASAAGVQAVLLAPGCVDAWSPKVLRAGMGAHFKLPVLTLRWKEIGEMLKGMAMGFTVFLADSAGGLPYTQVDFCIPLALIVGGEAAGAGAESNALADEKVHIPMPGGSESLNAGVAASILIFEVLRQRGSKSLK